MLCSPQSHSRSTAKTSSRSGEIDRYVSECLHMQKIDIRCLATVEKLSVFEEKGETLGFDFYQS